MSQRFSSGLRDLRTLTGHHRLLASIALPIVMSFFRSRIRQPTATPFPFYYRSFDLEIFALLRLTL
jgi:hypothetical protein